MTRGSLYLILNDKVIGTTEFNGDMYPSGYGDYIMKELALVKDEQSFKDMITKFNKENFGYEEELFYEIEKDDFIENYLDMNEKYHENYFSDYIFFKNISDEEIEFITSDDQNKIVILYPQSEMRLNFGDLVDGDEYEFRE